MKREVLSGTGTPTPMAHYCQGVLAGETVYAAGQIASDYQTGVAAEAREQRARAPSEAGGCERTRVAAEADKLA